MRIGIFCDDMALESWKRAEGRYAPPATLPRTQCTKMLKLDHQIGNVKWEAGLLTLLWPIHRNFGQIHRQETICEALIREIYINICEMLRRLQADRTKSTPRRITQTGPDGSDNYIFIPLVWAGRKSVGNEMFDYLKQRVMELSIIRLRDLRRKLKSKAMEVGYSDAIQINKNFDVQRLIIPLKGPRANARFFLQQLNSICQENYIVSMQADPKEDLTAVSIQVIPANIFEGNEQYYPSSFVLRRIAKLF